MELVANKKKSNGLLMLEDNFDWSKQAEDEKLMKLDRYDFLHNQFDDYRQKINKTLRCKDQHIENLQNRLNSLLREKHGHENNSHAIIAERDRLRNSLNLLEEGFFLEKSEWKEEAEKYKAENLSKNEKTPMNQSIESKEKLSCREISLIEIETKLQKAMLENCQLSAKLSDLTENLRDTQSTLCETLQKLENMEKAQNVENLQKTENLQISKEIENQNCAGNEDATKDDLLLANFQLRQELSDTKEFFEVADIEAEEKISMLANRLEELEEILENRNRECILLSKNLSESEGACKIFEEKSANFERNFFRQKDLMENLREEMEKLGDCQKTLAKEKDELLTKNASLSHQLNFQRKKANGERGVILHQLNLAGSELQDCMDKLKHLESDVVQNQQQNQKINTQANNFDRKIDNRANACQKINNQANFGSDNWGANNANYSTSQNSLNFHSSVANLTSKIDALERDLKTKQNSIGSMENKLMDIRAELLQKNYGSSDYIEN